MILALAAALALSQTQPTTLDQLRLVSGQLALGQVCEAVERSTINFEELGPYAVNLIEVAKAEGHDEAELNTLQEESYGAVMARIEQDYSEGREAPNFSTLLEECDTLNREHPRFFTPHQAED